MIVYRCDCCGREMFHGKWTDTLYVTTPVKATTDSVVTSDFDGYMFCRSCLSKLIRNFGGIIDDDEEE